MQRSGHSVAVQLDLGSQRNGIDAADFKPPDDDPASNLEDKAIHVHVSGSLKKLGKDIRQYRKKYKSKSTIELPTLLFAVFEIMCLPISYFIHRGSLRFCNVDDWWKCFGGSGGVFQYYCYEIPLVVLTQSVAQRLLEWRDIVSREMDESPAYVCPSTVLVKLVESQPNDLEALLKVAPWNRYRILLMPFIPDYYALGCLSCPWTHT